MAHVFRHRRSKIIDMIGALRNYSFSNLIYSWTRNKKTYRAVSCEEQ
jgi:hypothetical protein